MTNTPNLDKAKREARDAASKAYEAHDAVAMLHAETLAALYEKKIEFIRNASRVAKHLMQVAERAESDPDNHFTINNLGEVHAHGTEIDTTCAQIGTLRAMLNDIAAAQKAARRASESSS